MSDLSGNIAEGEEWLTLQQLCDLTGYSPATIHRWKAQGRIEYIQPGGKGGHLRFLVSSIRTALAKNCSLGTEDPKSKETPSKLPGRVANWKKSDA